MIQRECEKLFHPERFDLHDLTTSISTLEAANPDLGALFYAQNIKPASNIEKPSENVSNEEDNKRVVLEDPKSGELFQPIRKYGRSMSSQDPPKYGNNNVFKINKMFLNFDKKLLFPSRKKFQSKTN